MNILRLILWLSITLLPQLTLADPLFEQSDELSISLNADFKTIFKEKDKSKQYPATLVYDAGNGSESIDIKVEVRGNFRLENCAVPGLRLIFPKQKTGLFAKQKKLKLVAQCRKKGDLNQDYLLQEFAVYQAYETLTDVSFKSRLAHVTYEDQRGKPWTNYAFLLEDKGRMAKRLDMSSVRDNRVERSALSPVETNLVSIYMFLVGNTDFSLLKGEGDEACCHNAKLLDRGHGFVPVPYDFDLSGIINTRYAAPPVNLGIKKVTQRLYRGFCSNNEHVPATLKLIESKRDDIYRAFMHPAIRAKTQTKMKNYLDKFFELSNNPASVKRKILDRCR